LSSRKGGREWSRPVWRKRELGRSFYRRPGWGRGREVASTGELATAGMVRTVVATGWLGQTGRRDGSGRCKAPNRAGERDNGEATGQAVAGGDRVASPVTGARKALTSGARLPERERARVRAADGWGRAGNGRGARRQRGWARGGNGPRGPDGGRGARGESWARNGPTEGEKFSFFFFYFLFLFLFLLSPFILNQ
jgi:hypothetical protein